jgi:hypothetical protein
MIVRFMAIFSLLVVVSVIQPAAGSGTPSPAPAVPATPNGVKETLPGGTPITFQVSEKVSSGTANVGDTFGVKVLKDVVVDGWIVVAKGAGGLGEVIKVDRAGSHGHPGSLTLQLDYVYDVDGDKVKLTSEQNTQEGENKAGASSTATIISAAFLGLPGLFMHNFVKGHNLELTPENTTEHPLTAYVDTSVYIFAQTKADAGSGLAPTAPTVPLLPATPASSPSPR